MEGIGWTAAEALEPGQTLRLADGAPTTLIYAENTRERARVYNFEIDGWWWTHERNDDTTRFSLHVAPLAEMARSSSGVLFVGAPMS